MPGFFVRGALSLVYGDAFGWWWWWGCRPGVRCSPGVKACGRWARPRSRFFGGVSGAGRARFGQTCPAGARDLDGDKQASYCKPCAAQICTCKIDPPGVPPQGCSTHARLPIRVPAKSELPTILAGMTDKQDGYPNLVRGQKGIMPAAAHNHVSGRKSVVQELNDLLHIGVDGAPRYTVAELEEVVKDASQPPSRILAARRVLSE